MAEEWLVGVYRGELVTADDGYKKKVWDCLLELRAGGFLGYNLKRNKLAPYFFFLKPAEDAKTLDDIAADTRPSDFGLKYAAYESPDNGDRSPPEHAVPAKGRATKGSFAVSGLPEGLAEKTGKTGIAALALSDRTDGGRGIVRTGTFFSYETKDRKATFSPLMHKGRYLSGKGVLVGAWAGSSFRYGGMLRHAYLKERHCPLNIGSSYFQRRGIGFYITYRRVETDLRLDMPAVFLHLAKSGGFEHLAGNLGRSIDRAFGRHMDRIFLRDTLADGCLVDYEDINAHDRIEFDVRKDNEKLRALLGDVFKALYLSAATSAYKEDGLLATIRKESTLEFTENNFRGIGGAYKVLCKEFLEGLCESNRGYFTGKKGTQLPSIEDVPTMYRQVTGLTISHTAQKRP